MQILPKLHMSIVNGDFFKNEMLSVDEFMNISFELQESNRKKITINDYLSKYNKHLKPFFGDKKFDEIKPTDITRWQNEMLKKRYAITTIKRVRGILNTMFEDAIKDEVINKNPVKNASLLSERKGLKFKKYIEPFSIEEINNLLNNAQREDMKNLYALLFMTGVRGGEALALKWDKVDFNKKSIDIDIQVGRGVLSSPKWDSYRTFPIIDGLIPFLKKQYEITGKNNSYLFLNKDNTHYWDIAKIREHHWKEDLARANIKYRNIHQTRHTFCSTLISSGEDINHVSKVAGHKTTKMTLEVYSKYIPNNNKSFGKIFNEKVEN